MSHVSNPRCPQNLLAAASFEDKSAAARQKVLLQSVLLQVLRTKGKA
jgi:hypothetical protein